ncbi:hypothetical protein ACPTKK_31740, partial [Pseudomonas aeruginosa]|uniref:hypothetical protein n=1 Tax=Pseudomonas aeruginosa TaxID=287 RepID=UPI003CC51BF2
SSINNTARQVFLSDPINWQNCTAVTPWLALALPFTALRGGFFCRHNIRNSHAPPRSVHFRIKLIDS